MLGALKEIILNFQDSKLNCGVSRDMNISTISGKATICIGVRRSGKSTLMFQIIDKLLKKGVKKENILYLNFFDDRLYPLQHTELNIITEAYYSLFPEKKNSEKVYCFFDEIQLLNGWESFVERILRTENCEVYITGSSAKMLSKEIASQMRGRSVSWEIFPFSFSEFLKYNRIDQEGAFTTKKRLTVQKAFDNYFREGSFPETTGLEDSLRIKIHQEYFNAVLFRDLIERYDVFHPKSVLDLAHRLMDNIGSLYSLNNLTGYLKSLGHKVQKSTVSDYLLWFEDAYFLFTIRMFDASISRSNANPKKIYCIDHSMIRSVSSNILVNSGHLLENIVFNALRRLTTDIFYYKTKNGKEVDFIILRQDRSKELIQVCETMTDENTRKREVNALVEAMNELNLKSGTIVTKNDDEEILVENGKINVIPAWRFLLSYE
ncbi:MAG: ATP-binding protein [Candidatus Delongbacteria bacterium]|nr:ATP-binding protein [Candidatus Delongbacteria bacterium]